MQATKKLDKKDFNGGKDSKTVQRLNLISNKNAPKKRINLKLFEKIYSKYKY